MYMEVFVSLAALGGLYLISNKKREPFQTITPSGPDHNVNEYKNPNQVTDKHFKPIRQMPQYITDMADRNLTMDDFTSNNMVPFFTSEKKLNGMGNVSEQQLDAMAGAGSLQIMKKEIAPLFKPEDNVEWPSGAPNQSDFYQSRVNPGMKISNVQPFESQLVGPGLGKGFGAEGSGGFNSGMEARQNWIDKTVDELRVLTNPKESFELTGLQGPAQTSVKNVGIEGKMEKYSPDTFFINSPERYFTTTGAEQKPTLRALQPESNEHRATTTREYSGVAGNTGVPEHSQRGVYRIDHRQQLSSETITPAMGMGKNNLQGVAEGYQLLCNNRSVQHSTMGNIQGVVSAITAPITDLLRPSRKEDIIHACRTGNPTSSVANTTVFNPADRLSTTTKETTLFSPFDMGQRPHDSNGHMVNNEQPIQNQRDTTSTSYVGNGQGSSAMTSYGSAYNATIHANREAADRAPNGNATFFNNTIQQQSNNLKSNTHTHYTSAPASFNSLTPAASRFGEIRQPQHYEEPNRMESTLLDAFKKNPYTHSLSSIA